MWIGEFELSRVRSPLSSQRLPCKLGLSAIVLALAGLGSAQAAGPFAPAAGKPGSTAISKDSADMWAKPSTKRSARPTG